MPGSNFNSKAWPSSFSTCAGSPQANGDEGRGGASLCLEMTPKNSGAQEALGKASRQWLMRKLHEMTSRGRSPIAAEINFVAAHAHYWRYELKAVLGNSRSENYDDFDERRQQRGLLADFVRLSAEMIPAEYKPC
jgi:hypothetical protein